MLGAPILITQPGSPIQTFSFIAPQQPAFRSPLSQKALPPPKAFFTSATSAPTRKLLANAGFSLSSSLDKSDLVWTRDHELAKHCSCFVNHVMGAEALCDFEAVRRIAWSRKLACFPHVFFDTEEFVKFAEQNPGQYVDMLQQRLFLSTDLGCPTHHVQVPGYVPMLYKEHKFSIRLYALIAGVYPLQVAVSQDGIAYVAEERFDQNFLIDKSYFPELGIIDEEIDYVKRPAKPANEAKPKDEPKDEPKQDDAKPITRCLALSALEQELNLPLRQKLVRAVQDLISAFEPNLVHRKNSFELLGIDFQFTAAGDCFIENVVSSLNFSYRNAVEKYVKVQFLSAALHAVGIRPCGEQREQLEQKEQKDEEEEEPEAELEMQHRYTDPALMNLPEEQRRAAVPESLYYDYKIYSHLISEFRTKGKFAKISGKELTGYEKTVVQEALDFKQRAADTGLEVIFPSGKSDDYAMLAKKYLNELVGVALAGGIMEE